MAEYVELYMDRGADYNTTLTIQDDNNNMPQDLTDCNVRCQMKRSLVSPNVYATLNAYVSNAAMGEITLSLDAANTRLIRPGPYFYDVKIIDNYNSANTKLIEGMIYVSPSISD